MKALVALCMLVQTLVNARVRWKLLEDDTYYIGNDIKTTLRPELQLCAEVCNETSGCRVFVWTTRDGGTCFLKGDTTFTAQLAGAKAGCLVDANAIPTMSTKRSKHTPSPASQRDKTNTFTIEKYTEGAFPLEKIVFHALSRAMWADYLPNAMYKANLTDGIPLLHRPFLDVHNEVITPFHHVESLGECARISLTYEQTFFTYLSDAQICILPHLYLGQHIVAEKSFLHLKNIDGNSPLHVHSTKLSTTFIRPQSQSIEDPDACKSACSYDSNCAASEFRGGKCILYGPKKAPYEYVYAGWIAPIVQFKKEHGNIQFAFAQDLALMDAPRKSYQTQSLTECAELAAAKARFLFEYRDRKCSIIKHLPPSKSQSFFYWTPTSPIQVRGSLPTSVPREYIFAPNASMCSIACVPTETGCIGSVWAHDSCSLYLPTISIGSTVGWIRSTPEYSPKQFKRLHFFPVAHQDDHELFMAHDVMKAMSDPEAKVVFLYTTAGDAWQKDGWWEAREAGTLAASTTLLELLDKPFYSTDRKISRVLMDNVQATRVQIGLRTMHYFLRLSEGSLYGFAVANSTKSRLTVDYKQIYNGTNDLQRVISIVLGKEADGIDEVHIGTSEFIQPQNREDDDEVDHDLHRATGRLASNVVESHPLWKNCVHQTYYFGYQRWLHPSNLPEPERSFQRYMWLRLSKSIQDLYSPGYPVWLDHSHVLGKQYVAREVKATRQCN